MKHKHYDLLMAFANGADIQYRMIDKEMEWLTDANPWWNCERMEFRIKPEPPPDFIKTFFVHGNYFSQGVHISESVSEIHNLVLTFDGETFKLKNSEVI